jgi:hypothetical protein
MTTSSSPHTLSDRDLLAQLKHAVAQERQATAHVIALLMEVDSRKVYAKQSCSSLFTYCVQVLHLSEHAAYLRIEAARAARRFPAILDRLAAARRTGCHPQAPGPEESASSSPAEPRFSDAGTG